MRSYLFHLQRAGALPLTSFVMLSKLTVSECIAKGIMPMVVAANRRAIRCYQCKRHDVTGADAPNSVCGTITCANLGNAARDYVTRAHLLRRHRFGP